MRSKFVLTIIFIQLSLFSFSQNPDEEVVIFTNSPRLELYWGYDNYIRLSGKDLNSDDIDITVADFQSSGNSKGYVNVSKEGNKWLVKCGRGVKNVTLDITKNGEKIYSKEIGCFPMHATKMYLGPYENGRLAILKSILEDPCVYFQNRYVHVQSVIYTVESIELQLETIQNGDIKKLSYTSNGNCFSDEMITALNNYALNGPLYIIATNRGPDGIRRKHGMTLTLIDAIDRKLMDEQEKVAQKDVELLSREKKLDRQDSLLAS